MPPYARSLSGPLSLILVVAGALGACGDDTTETAAQAASASSAQSTSSAGAGATTSNGQGGSGGTGAATTSSSSAGGATGGAGGAACASLSDEFDDAATLGCWSRLHEVLGGSALHELLDVDATVAGHLVIEPYASGWYQNDRGPFLFKMISGNFVVEVHAAALDESNPAIPPTGDYHTAGIVARDPASVTGSENWIMYNTGHQNDQGATTGTEGKTTVNSVSTLTINQANHSGLLRLCRVGDEFYLLKNLDDESTWTQEHHYTRADLPNALQVGLITNAWPPGAAGEARNMQGRFDHFRVGTATSLADCTAAITPL